MLGLLLAAVIHMAPGPHHWPFPPGWGFGGYGYGTPLVGVSVLPSTSMEYINGIPYEVVGGQLVPVGGIL